MRTTGCDCTGVGVGVTGAATGATAAGAAGVVAVGVEPCTEIFGGVTGFGVGGVPPLGELVWGAPADGAEVAPACGLFWK
ncbi:unannotated protein [freshwater metagenome]|uniref:Unannotated protein n=1 Tax=freshwater metagenome TaxID=449393 RepID=A0A6J7TV35_9ZZZZ